MPILKVRHLGLQKDAIRGTIPVCVIDRAAGAVLAALLEASEPSSVGKQAPSTAMDVTSVRANSLKAELL